MASKRRDAATAGVGYGLVAAGGAIRGKAIDDAHHEIGHDARRLKPASLAVLAAKTHKVENAGKIVRRFGGGSALVTVGAPAAGLGTMGLLRRKKVSKRHQDNIVVEGVKGTGEALKQKGQSLRSGAPTKVRAQAIGLGAAGAAGGSLVAHRVLDQVGKHVRVGGRLRAATTAVAAVPGALATMPASRRLAAKHGYTVTPTGTHKMSKAAQQYKHNDYLGRHVSPRQQRIRTYAAGAAPVVGSATAAAQAARYAPPGQQHKAAARQLSATAASVGAGVYAGRKLGKVTESSPSVEAGLRRAGERAGKLKAKLPTKAQHAMDVPGKAESAGRRLLHMKPKVSGPRGAKALGAVVGYKAASALVGNAGGQLATTRNLHAQRKFNAHHPVAKGWVDNALEKLGPRVDRARAQVEKSKAEGKYAKRPSPPKPEQEMAVSQITGRLVPATSITVKKTKVSKLVDAAGMTDKQKTRLVRRKRLSADLTTVGGVTGLGALAMVSAKHPRAIEHRGKLLAVSAGVGGVNALNSAGISRKEARAEKATISKHDRIHARQGAHTLCGKHVKDVGHTTVDPSKVECARCQGVMMRALGPHAIWAKGYGAISKGNPPIQTTLNDKEAHKIVHGKGGYGLTGPLPRGLDRDSRKTAYEARYIASGGKKSQRWQKVSNAGQETATAGVAGATAAGLALIGTKSPGVRRLANKARKIPRLAHVDSHRVKDIAEHAAVVSATAGGVGQLASQLAKKRRAKYTSAPGGVAASALRRMQAYTPAGG